MKHARRKKPETQVVVVDMDEPGSVSTVDLTVPTRLVLKGSTTCPCQRTAVIRATVLVNGGKADGFAEMLRSIEGGAA